MFERVAKLGPGAYGARHARARPSIMQWALAAKFNLKAWRRHHSRSLESNRQRHTISDGNVALEKRAGCCT